MSRMKSAYRECRWCHVRLLLVNGIPALNYMPDPAGKVAVSIDDPKRGRFLRNDEEPGRLEKRYSVHECDGTRQHAQRGQWTSAQRGDKPRRNRSWKQPKTQMTMLPGMTRRAG